MRLCLVWAMLLGAATGCSQKTTEVDETHRIRRHLAAVETQMRETSPQGLTDRQRSARSETLQWLEDYRIAGRFPHNHVERGARVPVFVDPHGTPCAVGYLLLRSGETALVEEVVRADNLVRVPDLATEPRLVNWLAERGITLAEAAAIQPTYGPRDPLPFPEDASNYSEITLGASLISAAVASYSLAVGADETSGYLPEVLGVASLGFHSAMAGVAIASDEHEPSWAVGLNVAAALLSGFAVVDRFLARGEGNGRGSEPTMIPFLASGRVGLSVVH